MLISLDPIVLNAWLLEAQYRNMREFSDRPAIAIRSDALTMAARRIWGSLAEQEPAPGHEVEVSN